MTPDEQRRLAARIAKAKLYQAIELLEAYRREPEDVAAVSRRKAEKYLNQFDRLTHHTITRVMEYLVAERGNGPRKVSR